ncbi:spermatogenesis-associated protein 20-like isoform X2 [Xenia sp. Carnegie-2017]|uniref:spermatogenesis-associated protein 20-like isoform X2 n=1 Tax=Xenia sp. Carnegie-2017 TaxID=2897299 RepID=UPI001F041610|nr:spermatogenesis-associated protein 20-like isoform X2 [Xenia sp. Carnegie-2017]
MHIILLNGIRGVMKLLKNRRWTKNQSFCQSLLGFSNRVKGIHDCLHKRKIKSYTYVNVRTGRRTRTRRGMMTTTSGKKANRLLKERSPYLLQHAYNPVEWYPWGDEAFEKSKMDEKPIFLSVGYSTCHWCHVMERESFENDKIAAILNEYFVPIKVDREERPDVDRVYMNFVQATTGHGGWPMSVWLMPDLQPFLGGTYFPPEDSNGRHGFKSILTLIIQQWKENKNRLGKQGSLVMTAIKRQLDVIMNSNQKSPEVKCIDDLFTKLTNCYNEKQGGFGGAPRFPQPSNLSFLLNYYAWKPDTKNGKKALEMTLRILDAMDDGGIHDHVGQGFHRYSTDGDWHVPHFEKMLYDQSQIADIYLNAYQISQDEKYSSTAKDILLYVMRDLSDKHGGFYAAEDADSLPSFESKEKKEGAFCVWEEEEIRTKLSETANDDVKTTLADLFIFYYGVEKNGNVKSSQDPHGELKNKNVLIVRKSVEETAKHFELDESTVRNSLCRAREILFEERLKRPKPHLDSKMVTSWNGLMIAAFAKASCVLKNDIYLKRALKAAEFVQKYLWLEESKKLIRSCYKGENNDIVQLENPVEAFSDDYSFLIYGLLELYHACFDEKWLKWAEVLQERQNELLWDDEAGGYFEAGKNSNLLIRLKQDQDGAEPSGSSIAALNLMRLASFLEKHEYRDRAGKIFAVFEQRLSKLPNALPKLMAAFITYTTNQKQIIIVGERDSNDTKSLLHVVHSHFMPNMILILHDEKEQGFLDSKLEVLKTLHKVNEKSTVYVCENFTCNLPVTSCEKLEELLKEKL